MGRRRKAARGFASEDRAKLLVVGGEFTNLAGGGIFLGGLAVWRFGGSGGLVVWWFGGSAGSALLWGRGEGEEKDGGLELVMSLRTDSPANSGTARRCAGSMITDSRTE